MRKEKEIKFAVGMLKAAGNEVQTLQVAVLENRRTEAWVFENYVKNVAEENKDEAKFFAARDAARYLAGSIELEELLPEVDFSVMKDHNTAEEEQTITLSYRDYKELVKRVERIERRMGLRAKINETKRKDATEAPKDLISQVDACRMLGCGKSTIKRWADNSFITGYTIGRRVYYSKKELNNSDIVKEYRASKEESK